jgi:AcrR family transcriptional regulator
MSSSLQTQTKPERYHHGDLKNALLEAARELASENGVDHFTLREVARRANVSPAAPYHHFADKQDLIRTLAIEAFEKLTTALSNAKQKKHSYFEQLEQLGIAYVLFAYEHITEFRFMFRRELCASINEIDPLEVAGINAQEVLYNTVVAAQQAKQLINDDPRDITMTLWSVVHGLSTIINESPISKTMNAKVAKSMAQNVIRHTLHGLINIKGVL